jgi:predicted GNAT family acetyltransferase
MPAIFIPRTRRLLVPDGAVRLAGASPLVRGLEFAWLGGQRRSLVRNLSGTPTGVALATSRAGRATAFAGGAEGASDINFGTYSRTSDLHEQPATFAFLATSNVLSETALACHTDANSDRGWSVGYHYDDHTGPQVFGLGLVHVAASTNLRVITTTLPPAGSLYALVIASNSTSAGTKIWLNGVPCALSASPDATGGSGIASAESLYLGRRRFDTALSHNGKISLALIASRVWSDSEVAAFSSNPFGFLETPSRAVYSWGVAVGGSNTPMTINATQTQAASMVKGQGRFSTLSATQTQTPSRLRSAGRLLSSVHVQSTSAGPSAVSGLGFTATQAQTPSRVRALGGPKAATETQTSTRLRLVSSTKSATNTQTPSVTKGQGYFKTLTATVVQTAVLARALGLFRSITQVQTLFRAVAIARALSAVETQSKALARAITTGRAVTGAQSASLTKAADRLHAATQTQTASRSRALARALSVTAAQTLVRVRALAKALSVTNSETPSVQVVPSGGGPINYPMTLNATVAQTIALARACARPLSALQSQSITRSRVLALLAKSATQTQAPSLVKGQGYFKTLTSTAVQTAARVLGLGVARGATQTQAATATRGFAATRTAIATQIANAARALGIRKAANQTQTPTLAKGRGFFVTLAAVAIQVATVVRNIGTTRFATQAHALDIQSEVAGGGFPILVPAPPKYTARGRDLRSAIYTTKGRSLRS